MKGESKDKKKVVDGIGGNLRAEEEASKEQRRSLWEERMKLNAKELEWLNRTEHLWRKILEYEGTELQVFKDTFRKLDALRK
ncbi:unnamed protein product [Linum trigynum]